MTVATKQAHSHTRKRLTREQSKAATRAAVLESAASIFAHNGYHGASVEQVADAAGFSKGAVYSNFSSKEELFLALLDERLESQLNVIAEVLESNEPLQSKLDSLSRLPAPSLGQRDGDWCLLAMEFWLYAARDPAAGKKLAARRRLMRDRFAEFVEQHAPDSRDPSAGAPEDLATVIIALGNGLQMHRSIHPGVDTADLFRLGMELILGISPAVK